MNIFITGAGGHLGRDLLRVLGPTFTCTAFSWQELDICDLRAVQKMVGDVKPDVVINAMTYSNVDQAEEVAEEAYRINALGVSNLAIAAESAGAKLVHVSTDYRFDGITKGALNNDMERTNLNIYGKSNLLGEQFVKAVCPRHFIVRSLAGNLEMIKAVDNQVGSPALRFDLAEYIGRLITTERYGTYQVSNSGIFERTGSVQI
ncbi:NAD(P)-dependent oxidoreductase [Paenibacillus sp. OV219]|uniref:SDR family oxidoreductase n=1 Tax=Paenibacillus sp. OV219 TaxID=1884377 RepID=UPI0008AFD3A6|nr:NAD(P)-dependent oxidoreductase [Paenibacillus sp. OV219]SEN04315.1 dTDP-4-dehydrorhamnose reductase [Paenibacillus sp. OV219]